MTPPGQTFSLTGMMDIMHKILFAKSPVLNFRQVANALSLALFCLVVSPGALAGAEAEVVDRIVAVVNDEIIVLQEVDSLVQGLRQNLDASAYSNEEKQRILADMRQSVIDTLVNRKLIVQAAKELEWLTVSESEVDSTLQRYMQQNNLTEEQLREGLKAEGLTIEDFRTQMKESSLSSSLENYEVASKIVITREDVKQYYSQNTDKYSGRTTYHLRNIYISAPSAGNTRETQAVENKLAQISAGIEAGEPFENLARKFSESAYASEGGELGNLELKDLTPTLRDAIEPLSPGEATPPIETGDGYQILYVQDIHKESDVPMESVYSEIEKELYNQQYSEKQQSWIEGLREKAHIKIID
jgi:peptidyl-prolyl cis-trans isomerase SurA